MSAKEYIQYVDETLDKLRSHWLGLDIPFERFLPNGGSGMEIDERTRWLADRMSFMLISNTPWVSLKEAEAVWCWLYGLIRYLYRECDKDDMSFYSVVKLIKLDVNVRRSLFGQWDDSFLSLCSASPPAAFSALEEAVIELAGEKVLRRKLEIWETGK